MCGGIVCSLAGWFLLFLGCMNRGFLSRDCAHQVFVHTDLQFSVSYELFELNRNWVLLLTHKNCFHHQMYNFWLHKIASYYTIHILKTWYFLNLIWFDLMLVCLTLILKWHLKFMNFEHMMALLCNHQTLFSDYMLLAMCGFVFQKKRPTQKP